MAATTGATQHRSNQTNERKSEETMVRDANVWLEQTMEHVEAFAREKPWHFGMYMFGIGFVLGWKLKFF
jgi:hypothetical protein